MHTKYREWLSGKSGFSPAQPAPRIPMSGKDHLFGFQRTVVNRALSAGRFAIFAATGLGKTAMQLEWARNVADAGRVLILAPLAVAEQTAREGDRFGVPVHYCRKDTGGRIVITNYEMIHAFEPGEFAGVVLDESSILKSFSGKLRQSITDSFRSTPYRLATTATPSPNDHMELGNHAEFLGVRTAVEMLSEYFVHDGGDTSKWRLKGHAGDAFWQWVNSWSVSVRMPSDVGGDDTAFVLPPLNQHILTVAVDHSHAREAGMLFLEHAQGLNEQRAVRRATMADRVTEVAKIANESGQCLVWCEGNAEADACTRAIDGAVQVAGADSREDKVDRLLGFAEGRYRVLVTKPKIAGFGMNWQRCNRMVFAGVSNSFEQTYQAIRRCWRFGQRSPVDVYTVATELDSHIMRNLARKADQHNEMVGQMASHSAVATSQWLEYEAKTEMVIPRWMTNRAKGAAA